MTTAWVALGAVPVVVTLVRLVRTMPADQDEAWFLLVATRLARGRRLYAEVFYGAGPLPVWAAAVLVGRRGASLRSLRTATAAVLALTSIVLLLLVAPAGGLSVVLTAVAVSGLVLARPPENAYGVAARAGAVVGVSTLAAADPALVGDRAVDGGAVLALAALSGLGLVLSLFSKHTLGAAASLVVLPGWFLVAGPVAAAVTACSTVVGSVVVLLRLDRRRELRGFVRRTLTDKGTYLATARLTFTGEARRLVVERPGLWGVDLTAYAVTAAAPPACAVGIAVGAPGALEALGLAAVSLAGTFPRACPSHVRSGAALALTSLVLVLASLPVAGVPVTVLLAVLGALSLAAVWPRPRPDPGPLADVLDGLPLSSPMPPQALADGRRVRELAGRRVLVLRADAAQWYLGLDLRNPTAYDYPLASTFGRSGQQAVADRLRPGDVEWCLLAPADAGPLTPHVLEDAVRSRMDPVLHTTIGVLHRARPRRRAPVMRRAASVRSPTVQG